MGLSQIFDWSEGVGESVVITTEEVARYERLRAASRRLNHRILKTLPRQAAGEIGAALGILRNEVLVFDTMDVTSVLMDCCLFDWVRGGKNAVERFAGNPFAPLSADERYLLQAYQKARYRLLFVETQARGAGVGCLDILANERIFLMDVAFSESVPEGAPLALATRTIPLGPYWMTSGAGLPIANKETVAALRRKLHIIGDDVSKMDPHLLSLEVVRTCLDSGAAEHVRYEGPESPEEEEEDEDYPVRLDSRPPHGDGSRTSRKAAGRNDPCPCGSGKKYKRCCLK